MESDLELFSSPFPATPLPHELWWVAVEGAQEDMGGWLILADRGARGLSQIQEAFQQADIRVLAAVDAQSLHRALGYPDGSPRQESSVAFRRADDGLVSSVHTSCPAQTLVELRLQHPKDVLVLVESQDAAFNLDQVMQQMLQSEGFDGIRMDLRDEPRGKGAWGLAMARTRQAKQGQ